MEDAVEPVSESVRDTEMALEDGDEHDNEEGELNQRNDEARQLHPEAPERGIRLRGRAPLIICLIMSIFVIMKKS